MQKTLNHFSDFKPHSYNGLVYCCLMHEKNYGGFGEYWCKSETLEDAIEEAKAAAGKYMGSRFALGDVIDRISVSERKSDGNTYHMADVEL